jgi:hypothetical protein
MAALLAGGSAVESQARAHEDQHLAAKDYTTEKVCDSPLALYYHYYITLQLHCSTVHACVQCVHTIY